MGTFSAKMTLRNDYGFYSYQRHTQPIPETTQA